MGPLLFPVQQRECTENNKLDSTHGGTTITITILIIIIIITVTNKIKDESIS